MHARPGRDGVDVQRAAPVHPAFVADDAHHRDLAPCEASGQGRRQRARRDEAAPALDASLPVGRPLSPASPAPWGVSRAALVVETADNLRFHHAKSSQTKLRTYASFTYQAGSWTRPRKVVARLECSLQPDTGGTTSTGMRQEVDIRYVVTSLKGSAHIFTRTSIASAGRWRT